MACMLRQGVGWALIGKTGCVRSVTGIKMWRMSSTSFSIAQLTATLGESMLLCFSKLPLHQSSLHSLSQMYSVNSVCRYCNEKKANKCKYSPSCAYSSLLLPWPSICASLWLTLLPKFRRRAKLWRLQPNSMTHGKMSSPQSASIMPHLLTQCIQVAPYADTEQLNTG
ncbi:hypothetical protein ABBQ32_010594 [Trebouxia sp. C0010 RCD-2024]